MQKLKGKKFMIHGEQLHLAGVATFSDEVDGEMDCKTIVGIVQHHEREIHATINFISSKGNPCPAD